MGELPLFPLIIKREGADVPSFRIKKPPTISPTTPHSTRAIRGGCGGYGVRYGVTQAARARALFWAQPNSARHRVWPRPGGSCRCTKVGALLLTPLLVHGQSEPRAAATLSRAEEGSQREAEAQDNQGDAKTRSVGGQEGEVDSLGKILAEAASAAPARALPGQLAQRQQSAPPLSPRVPTPSTTLEPRLGRHLHGGMQIFVKIISTQDQMRTR